MREEFSREGRKHLFAKTVREFPILFAGNYKANLENASTWWSKREALADLSIPGRRLGNLVGMASKGRRRLNVKAFAGRGRKRELWVADLYVALRSEFDRLHALDVKLSPSFLVCAAKHLVDTADERCSFAAPVAAHKKAIRERITVRWVQNFMQVHDLVIRRQAGNLATSPAKKIYIEKTVAFHLGALKRGFDSGSLQDYMVENADETHFVFNMDNGRTIGFRGQESVKYADVVSGGEGITMMVRLTEGVRAKIEAPMLVFINQNCSYPIRGVSDDVPGVSYRSGKKGWMDNRVFREWLSEPRAIKADTYGRKRVLFVDNCTGHNETDGVKACLARLNTELRKLPANATDLIQPADSFVISKLKDAWRKRWDEYKVGMMNRGEWMGIGAGSSGKLKNPGKTFFLKLAADAVRDINAQQDKNGLSYARKAMIRTGMGLNLNGRWEECQLFSHLQEIVAKHRNHFNGLPVE